MGTFLGTNLAHLINVELWEKLILQGESEVVWNCYCRSGGKVAKIPKIKLEKEESYEKTQVDPNLFLVFTLYGFC